MKKTGYPPDSDFAGVPLEIAHDLASNIAERLGPAAMRAVPLLASSVLPPQIYSLETVVLHAYMTEPPGEVWFDLAIGRRDARVGYRDHPSVRAHRVTAGYVIIESLGGGFGAGKGWGASLWSSQSIARHDLVLSTGSRPSRVSFGHMSEAERQLQSVVDADGGLPRKWRWDGLVGALSDWVPKPNDSDISIISWRGRVRKTGRPRRWEVRNFTQHGQIEIACNGHPPVPNGSGPSLGTVSAARRYCEIEDLR